MRRLQRPHLLTLDWIRSTPLTRSNRAFSFISSFNMISRLLLRRGFSTNLTRLPSNARSSRLFRWLELYEEFVGLKEVKHAQSAVNDVIDTAQEQFL